MFFAPLFRFGSSIARRRRVQTRVGSHLETFESRVLLTAGILAAEPRAASDFLGAWVVQNEFGEGALNIQQAGGQIEAVIDYLSAVGPINLQFDHQKSPRGSVLKLKAKKGEFGDTETGTARIKIRHNENNTLSGLIKLKVKGLDIKQRVEFTASRQEM